MKGILKNFFLNFSFISSHPEMTLGRKKKKDSSLQKCLGSTKNDTTGKYRYFWEIHLGFFQNSPFISRSRNDIQIIMKNVILILFFIGIVRIQKYFGFLSLRLYTYGLVWRRIDQQYSASNRAMFSLWIGSPWMPSPDGSAPRARHWTRRNFAKMGI